VGHEKHASHVPPGSRALRKADIGMIGTLSVLTSVVEGTGSVGIQKDNNGEKLILRESDSGNPGIIKLEGVGRAPV